MARVANFNQSPQQQPSTLGSQAADLFTGQPAPFLPQILPASLPDPTQLASEFENLFPDKSTPTDFFGQIQTALSNIPKPAPVVAPTVAPVTVAFPEGDADRLQQALFASQFAPVERALERREEIERQNLSAQLAQTGLAESGVGVGQQQKLSREVGEQVGSAAAAISESATASALQAKLAVAQQQANIDIQRNLANAQLDLASQQTNARNILERGAFEANALTQALGLDARETDSIRGQFLQFIDSRTQALLRQSEIARSALSDIFNAVLQDQATALRARELALAEQQEANRAGEAQQQLAQGEQQLGLQEQQLALNEEQLAQQLASQILQSQASVLAAGRGTGAVTDTRTGAPLNPQAQIEANARNRLASILGGTA